ncbi:MAG TPA: hypothetical protein ENI34_07250 [candidate division WOR-3 bacterium]|uniref:Uncharacterized protein n=1 Tax=candidate division WOR-3 bacterium TaxID=2052148 RepID=A0A9C9ENH4_UNCW3|nr:hypothetical protein [candidate division WOR-3 bacterium]
MMVMLLVLLSTYPWPIRPFGSAHQVSATLGDARGSVTTPRFHRGIDIPATNGTDVFSITSIDSAIVPVGEDYVRVGGYVYMHLTNRINNGDSVTGILDTTTTSPTQIGDVMDYGTPGPDGDHLHFQVGPAGGPYENPLSHNGGPVGYDDTGNPTISIDFWRQESEGDTAQQLVGVLDGKVDIRACCQDTQTSGGVNNTSGIYQLVYLISDTLGNVLHSDTTITFPQVQPPNNGAPVLLVYDRHNYRTASPFYYWATNRIVNNQVEDRYWNTKQRADSAGIPFPDSVDADSIEVARFKDGFYWVKVYAYDISDNADSESVLVHIDNFAPRVKQTYSSDWFAFVPTKQHKIWCCFSEAMDTTTLTAENIKIQSLKSDSFNYIITNINYIQADTLDTFTLYLEVDSFRYLNCC